MNKNDSADPTQQALQKSMGTFMPLMIIATFVIIPIPAGVLLYLITSNIIQILQTIIINKQIDAEQAKKKEAVNDDELKNAKKINEKIIKQIIKTAPMHTIGAVLFTKEAYEYFRI